MINKKAICIVFFLLTQACTPIDNYMLGKDNMLKPTPLEPMKASVQLNEQWVAPPAGGKSTKGDRYLKLKPVAVNNVIYTAEAGGLVKAINKKTGRLLWSQQLSSGLVSGPAVSQGYIVLATNSAKMIALTQAKGERVWETSVSSDVLAKPVITGNKVLAKTIDGNVYAFNLRDGEKIWLAIHGAPNLILKASSSPVIMNQLALVGFSDGRLDAIDLNTGAVVWQRSIAYASGASDVERLVDIDANPIVQGNLVYLASYQGYIGALSLANGEFLWRKPASTYKNIVMDGQTLYMVDSDDVVWAFDKYSGQVKWKQPALKARGLTEPVLVKGQLVVGDKLGVLHVLKTSTGAFVGRKPLASPIYIAPIVANNQLFVLTAQGALYCFSMSS